MAAEPANADMMPLASGMQWEEATQPGIIADVVALVLAIPFNPVFELLP